MTFALLLGGVSLALMGAATEAMTYLLAWVALGASMAGLLYEPALTVITAHLGAHYRWGRLADIPPTKFQSQPTGNNRASRLGPALMEGRPAPSPFTTIPAHLAAPLVVRQPGVRTTSWVQGVTVTMTR